MNTSIVCKRGRRDIFPVIADEEVQTSSAVFIPRTLSARWTASTMLVLRIAFLMRGESGGDRQFLYPKSKQKAVKRGSLAILRKQNGDFCFIGFIVMSLMSG